MQAVISSYLITHDNNYHIKLFQEFLSESTWVLVHFSFQRKNVAQRQTKLSSHIRENENIFLNLPIRLGSITCSKS